MLVLERNGPTVKYEVGRFLFCPFTHPAIRIQVHLLTRRDACARATQRGNACMAMDAVDLDGVLKGLGCVLLMCGKYSERKMLL